MTTRKNLLTFFLILIVLIMGLMACQPSTPSETPEPSPSSTSKPTSTPAPSPTPTPEPTSFIQEAQQKFLENDLEAAIELYQEALEIDAKFAPAYVGLGEVELWRILDNHEDALMYAQKAVDADPDSALAYALLARIYGAKNMPEEAVDAAEQAVDIDAEDGYIQAVLVNAYLSSRQYEQALDTAEIAYDLQPESAFVLMTLARVYERLADYSRARAALEAAVILEPEFFGWHADLGWFWLMRERYEQAESAFNKALELRPQSLSAMMGLARVFAERHDIETAEMWLTNGEALNGEMTPIYATHGEILQQQEQYDEALEQFNLVLEQNPDDYHTRIAVGFIYLNKDECNRAEREFQDLVDTHPRYALGHIGLGYARICAGDPSKALSYFRKAIEVDPYHAMAYVGMATAYAAQERWEDADEAFVEGIRLSPAPAHIHVALGNKYMAQELSDAAKAEYRVAAELNPYSQEALVGWAHILMLQDEFKNGLDIAEQALALDDTDFEAQQLFGTLQVLNNNPEGSIDYLVGVLDEDPENGFAHYILGMAYCQTGRYSDAKKEMETFLALIGGEADAILQNLLEALDMGFTLTESKVIEEMVDISEIFFDISPEFVIEGETEEARKLVVTVPLTAEDLDTEDSSDLYSKIGILAAVAALRLPRMDPAVKGGVLMEFERYGQPHFTVRVAYEDITLFFYDWSTAQSFVEQLEFTQLLPSNSQATLQTVERQIAEIRELDFVAAVPSETLSRQELQEHLTGDLDQQDHQDIQEDETVLELFGIIEPSVNLEELLVAVHTEQTAGFYTVDEKKFYVLDTDEQTSLEQTVIAHEYVHALQDQNFDIGPLTDAARNDDQQLAFRALMEGDATLSTYLYANENIPLVDRLQMISSAGGIEQESLNSSPVFVQEMMTFPYESGLDFVLALYDRGGWKAVNAAYESPPESTEQIIHPERYWDEDLPVSVTLPAFVSELGEEWVAGVSDVMGELGLQLWLATHTGPTVAGQAAEGWGGDQYVLMQAGDSDSHAVILETIWDDEDEASEFLNLYRTSMEHRPEFMQSVSALVGDVTEYWWQTDNNCVYAKQDGKSVTILVGTTRKVLEQIIK